MIFINNRILNFKKLNSIILVLLVYSNLRYFKISYKFTGINNFNFIQILGEISFYLLILTSLLYLININKSNYIGINLDFNFYNI